MASENKNNSLLIDEILTSIVCTIGLLLFPSIFLYAKNSLLSAIQSSSWYTSPFFVWFIGFVISFIVLSGIYARALGYLYSKHLLYPTNKANTNNDGSVDTDVGLNKHLEHILFMLFVIFIIVITRL